MDAKICMVTGANTGIGKEIARGLAASGAHVVMVCRDASKGEAARQEIQTSTGNPNVELLIADLSSQRSIRELAAEFKRRHQRLHVLVNNAGVSLSERSLTVDGIESTFAINHLAPFLLTQLLADVLHASAPARVVNVTSSGHASKIDLDDLQGEKRYGMISAYMLSKLGNIMFTYELARRLEGTGVTVNCVHPGVVRTELARDFKGAFFRVFTVLMKPFMKRPADGAATPLYVALAPEIEGVTGQYFADRKATRSKPITYDQEIARRLWDASVRLVAPA